MTVADPASRTTRWTAQWKELYEEVITTGLCTGCAGCVVTCPHDVIGYEHEEGKYIPFHLEEELGLDDCVPGFGSGGGCTTCHQTGYKGRTGIHELMVNTDELKDLIVQRTNANQLRAVAMKHGMITLRQDGWNKVMAGKTTIEEVARVTTADLF